MVAGAIEFAYRRLDLIDAQMRGAGSRPLGKLIDAADLTATLADLLSAGIARASNGRYVQNGRDRRPTCCSAPPGPAGARAEGRPRDDTPRPRLTRGRPLSDLPLRADRAGRALPARARTRAATPSRSGRCGSASSATTTSALARAGARGSPAARSRAWSSSTTTPLCCRMRGPREPTRAAERRFEQVRRSAPPPGAGSVAADTPNRGDEFRRTEAGLQEERRPTGGAKQDDGARPARTGTAARAHRRTPRRRAPGCARAPLHRRPRTLDAGLRDPSVARRRRLGRDHRRRWSSSSQRSAASLKDEFEIPGSDTQKATDLIESEFAAEQGGVLNLVFAAPEGETLDTPERQAAIEEAIAKLQTDEFAPTEDKAGHHERRRPLRGRHDLRRRAHRLHGGAVRPRHLRHRPRGGPRRAGGRPRHGRARGDHRRVQRRRRVPAHRAGDPGAARPPRGADRAADRVPHVRGHGDPDRPCPGRAHDRVPAAVHPRRAHRHQHDHAAARVDDRPRRRHRLLALHRHALPAVPPRGAVAHRRRRRGRRDGRAGRALRRRDGRHLGDRPRLLRPRLHHQARHRLRARRPDDGADRELAADRGPAAARPQGRPAEGAVPAAARRLRCGPREDADRPLGAVRDRAREGALRRPAARRPRSRVDLAARAARRVGSGHPAGRADRPPGLRPARRGLRRGLQRPDPDRRGRERAIPRRRSGSTTVSRASRASLPSASRSSTTRRRSRSSS